MDKGSFLVDGHQVICGSDIKSKAVVLGGQKSLDIGLELVVVCVVAVAQPFVQEVNCIEEGLDDQPRNGIKPKNMKKEEKKFEFGMHCSY